MANSKTILLIVLVAVLSGCKFKFDNKSAPAAADKPPTVLPLNNSAPYLSVQTFQTYEDSLLNAELQASDNDGDSLTFSLITSPTHGTLSLNAQTGAFQYQPNANFSGIDSFTVTVADAWVTSAAVGISLEVTEINDLPLAANAAFTTDEDINKAFTLTATDVDGNALTYSIVTAPQKGVIQNLVASTGAFTYVPNLNANGSDLFTFKANDGSADSNTATVSITINAVNDRPVAVNGALTINGNTAKTGKLVATDIDSSALKYSIVTNGQQGTATITDENTGDFTYLPNPNSSGTDAFTFKANDGIEDSYPAKITVRFEDRFPLQLAIRGRNEFLATDCEPYIVALENADGADVLAATRTALKIKGFAATFANAACTIALDQPAIPASASTFTFYIRKPKAEAFDLIAHAEDHPHVGSAVKNLISKPGEAAMFLVTLPNEIQESTCFTGKLVVKDTEGNPTGVSSHSAARLKIVRLSQVGNAQFTENPDCTGSQAPAFTVTFTPRPEELNMFEFGVIGLPGQYEVQLAAANSPTNILLRAPLKVFSSSGLRPDFEYPEWNGQVRNGKLIIQGNASVGFLRVGYVNDGRVFVMNRKDDKMGNSMIILEYVYEVLVLTGEGSKEVILDFTEIPGIANSTRLNGKIEVVVQGAASQITGSDFDDLIWGSAGNDTIFGRNGNDRIYGRGGVDYIDGGPGNDFILAGLLVNPFLEGDFDRELNGAIVMGGPGSDTIVGARTGVYGAPIPGMTGNLAYRATLLGGDGDDTIYNPSTYSALISGGSGDDVIVDAVLVEGRVWDPFQYRSIFLRR